MSEKRISGWFLVSAIFIIAVFGLFFTITERKSWPQQKVQLSATDMRLSPYVSTVWCEALALVSDHPFIAYQVSNTPDVNPKLLSKHRMNMRLKLSADRNGNSIKIKYFLLPSSMIEIVTCASEEGAELLVFKGDKNIESCMSQFYTRDVTALDSNYYDSDDGSYEDDDVDDDDDESIWYNDKVVNDTKWVTNQCPSLITHQAIRQAGTNKFLFLCDALSDQMHPLRVNISSADDYIIALFSKDPTKANYISLTIVLDRAQYVLRKTGRSFDMCSLQTNCTISLDFGSDDRALVWIPEEPNAGRVTFTVHSQCKPRLALFAVMSVCVPFVLFLIIAYVVRIDKRRANRAQQNSSRSSGDICCVSRDGSFGAPLLHQTETRFSSNSVAESPSCEESPPPYNSLYDQPPSYASLKIDENK